MESSAPSTGNQRGAVDAGAVLLVCWAVLAVGVANSNGHYDPRSLAAVLLAWALAAVGLLALARGHREPNRAEPPGALRVALALAVGAALASSLAYPAGIYGVEPAVSTARALAMLATCVAVATVFGPGGAASAAGALVIVLATAGSLVMTVASPRPSIDVWFLLTQGAEWTLRGANAYGQCWINSTDPLTTCVYPYLPGQLLVDIPFVIFGEVRYASVVALTIAAFAVWRIAALPVAAALAALVVIQPKGLFLVEQAWTEPVLVAAMCVMVWAVIGQRSVAAMGAFALALACKQHMLLLVPLAAWWPAFGMRRTAVSVLAAAAVTLPWVLTAPAPFFDDAVLFNLVLPPRLDSLGVYAWLAQRGIEVPFALVGMATLAVIGACMTTLPRDARGFTVGSAFVLLTFSVLNKQSFFNHYSLVLGLLVLATAVVSRHAYLPGAQGAGVAAPAAGRAPQELAAARVSAGLLSESVALRTIDPARRPPSAFGTSPLAHPPPEEDALDDRPAADGSQPYGRRGHEAPRADEGRDEP
jgi:hypothetical protein